MSLASEPTDMDFDRLVDGELSNAERAALLRRLDMVPDGWRRCALAFLEAQAWRTAMVEAPAAEHGTPATLPLRKSGRPVLRLASVAASAAAAFVLGWALRGEPHGSKPVPEVPSVASPGPSAPPEPVPEAVGVEPPAAEPNPVDAIVRHWEQRGYQAEARPRVVTVKSGDGRTVNVPVQEVRVRSLVGRTY